jgi:hypothetical protein
MAGFKRSYDLEILQALSHTLAANQKGYMVTYISDNLPVC